jgi:hypothetical protein
MEVFASYGVVSVSVSFFFSLFTASGLASFVVAMFFSFFLCCAHVLLLLPPFDVYVNVFWYVFDSRTMLVKFYVLGRKNGERKGRVGGKSKIPI